LREGEDHLEHGVGAALERARREALQQRHRADHDPRQPGAEGDRAGKDDGDARGGEQRQGDGPGRHPERAGVALADLGHQCGSGQPGGDGAQALDGEEDAEERRRPVEAIVHDGKDDRLAQAQGDDGHSPGAYEAAQVGGGADVGEAGAELARVRRDALATAIARRARSAPAAPTHRGQCGGGSQEARRIEGGDGRAAERREEAGAGERREQAQRFAQRLHGGVAVADQLGREDRDEESGLAGAQERRRGAERGHHGVDDPDVAGVVDEEERGDGGGAREVDHDEQRALRQAVHEQARDRRRELGEEEGAEREAGGAVAAGERLDPRAHGEGEREVAEERECLASEVEAGVA
jgi:hypothetical protein